MRCSHLNRALYFNLRLATMNEEEKLAENYLKSISHHSLIFEPEGNVPPDFLLNENIAIEVTRLNDHYEYQGALRRYDDDRMRILSYLENSLKAYDCNLWDVGFYVHFKIRRPFGNLKRNGKLLLELLHSFDTAESVFNKKLYIISDGLSVSFDRHELKDNQQVFKCGVFDEYEEGCLVVEEMLKNAKYCIERKSSKIAPYYDNYEQWWLILIDAINYGHYEESIDILKNKIDKSVFNKVVFLEAVNGSYIFEI